MPKARLRPAAERDLEEIGDYSEQKWGTRQAHIYIKRIVEAIGRLAREPDLGRRCDHIRRGYRRLGVGRHAIYFIVESDGPVIIRILHDRMDQWRALEDGSPRSDEFEVGDES